MSPSALWQRKRPGVSRGPTGRWPFVAEEIVVHPNSSPRTASPAATRCCQPLAGLARLPGGALQLAVLHSLHRLHDCVCGAVNLPTTKE